MASDNRLKDRIVNTFFPIIKKSIDEAQSPMRMTVLKPSLMLNDSTNGKRGI